MQFSRDLTERPGVGTLMYMGEEPVVPSSPSPVARAIVGGIGALAIRHALKKSSSRVGLVDGAVGIGGGYLLFRALFA